MPPATIQWSLLLWMALAVTSSALGATVRVVVVDEDGSPVDRAQVRMQRIDDGETRTGYRRRFLRSTADGSGRASLTEIEPGEYLVRAGGREGLFVHSEDNPLADPVRITLESPEQVVDVRLELHRGTHLCTRFVIDGSRRDVAGAVLRRELETGFNASSRLDREEERCGQLFAGRWELELNPPRGYLLVDLEVNGASTPGHIATLDVRPGSPSQYVTWYLRALARLDGHVYFRDERFSVRVQAELLEGGPWRADADSRGGSLYSPVIAGPDETGYYAMDLPDGRWLVRTVGDDLEEAEPAELEIVLGRGEQRTQDFAVRGRPSESGPGLFVHVMQPDGDHAKGAVVELWPPNPADRGDAPLAVRALGNRPFVMFRELEPGSYRLVAGHPDYLENAKTIQFDPENDESRRQSIRLRKAAELRVRFDTEEQPRNVRIELERSGEPATTELADEGLVSALRHPRAEVDATNRAHVRGIYTGTYTIRGSGDDVFVEFENGERWTEELTLQFDEGRQHEIDGRFVSAGRISGSLFCLGGEPLPSSAALRIVPTLERPEHPLETDWTSHVALGRERVLEGRHRDRFTAAPLDPGSYVVALQPTTFDRWTWSVGVENGAEAQSVEIVRGGEVDLGAIGVECGPAIHVTLEVQDGEAGPDLDEVRLQRGLEITAQVVTAEEHSHEIERPTLEAHARLLVLRGFPEGRVTGELQLSHRYFLPEAEVRVPFEGRLERGRTVWITVPVASIGGAVTLPVPDGNVVTVRATDERGVTRSEAPKDGRATFGNLRQGRYRFESCADTECGAVLHVWDPVEVQALKTLELSAQLR